MAQPATVAALEYVQLATTTAIIPDPSRLLSCLPPSSPAAGKVRREEGRENEWRLPHYNELLMVDNGGSCLLSTRGGRRRAIWSSWTGPGPRCLPPSPRPLRLPAPISPRTHNGILRGRRRGKVMSNVRKPERWQADTPLHPFSPLSLSLISAQRWRRLISHL